MWNSCFSNRYDNCSLASGSQEFNRRITDITQDIQALGFQDTHGDIEEEDYYLWCGDKKNVEPSDLKQTEAHPAQTGSQPSSLWCIKLQL